MAYLNSQERQKLLEELSKMNFNKARGKLRGLDPQGRIAYYRNAQTSGKFHTRYDLDGLGTRVTLVESRTDKATKDPRFTKNDFEMVEVIVEPMPENRL